MLWEERAALALPPAPRRPQSAGGAAQGLHSVVQRVGRVTPDGYQPDQHPQSLLLGRNLLLPGLQQEH